MTRLPLIALMGVLALAGCAGPSPSGQAHGDAATLAACRQRAEETYNQQNRGDIYRPQAQVNTPYSADYAPSTSGRGLAELFAHDRLINDCVRNTGTGTERSTPAVSSAPFPSR